MTANNRKTRFIQVKKGPRKGQMAGSVGGPGVDAPTPAAAIATLAREKLDDAPKVEKPFVLAPHVGPSVTAVGVAFGASPELTLSCVRDLVAEAGKADVQRIPGSQLRSMLAARIAAADLDPQTRMDALRALQTLPEGLDPRLADALLRLPDRAAQQAMIQGRGVGVPLDAPGSQKDKYEYGEDGRVTKLYYASYGSNLFASRLHAYIEGGQPEGSARKFEGARDKTLPSDDIPVQLNGTIFYAGKSSIWNGGVAFLDPEREGKSLGRAYLVTSEQFDDVIAQENGGEAGTMTVDLATTIEAGRKVGPGVYGTLVHVGDYNGHPVVTFTSPFDTATAREGKICVTPTGNIADTQTRQMTSAGRKILHALRQSLKLPKDRKSLKNDWPVYTNGPTQAYIDMISRGLAETHNLTPSEIKAYFAGACRS